MPRYTLFALLRRSAAPSLRSPNPVSGLSFASLRGLYLAHPERRVQGGFSNEAGAGSVLHNLLIVWGSGIRVGGRGGGAGLAEVVRAGACGGGGTLGWKSIQINPNSCSAESGVCFIGAASRALGAGRNLSTIKTRRKKERRLVGGKKEGGGSNFQYPQTLERDAEVLSKSAILWPRGTLLYARPLVEAGSTTDVKKTV